MNIVFSKAAWEDYQFWQEADRKMVKKINELLRDIVRSPFEGIGKPESLKYDLAGFWSRRINAEHRLVYKVDTNSITVISCRYHYD
jgi:toxin YoeB